MELTLPLDQMTTEDKLRAIEEIWSSLVRSPDNIPSPGWHADELRATEQRVQEGKSKFVDWEQAKQSIRDQTR